MYHVDIEEILSITPDGLRVLVPLLCDPIDANATWQSNHTICDIGNQRTYHYWLLNRNMDDDANTTEKLLNLLMMNRERDKSSVARKKVLQCHFAGGFFNPNADLSLSENITSLLPRVLSWFGKDELGHSVLFDLVKKNASVFEYTNGSQPT